jgi:dephospho-CoA kinase
MLRVGLTGGIGCGKTTVAGFLGECGIPVLDADPLAQNLMAPGGPAHDDVIRAFGAGILDAHGDIDRRKLAEIVFANHAALAKLNALVHPHVATEIEKQFAEWSLPGGPPVAVVEAALLIEAGYRDRVDRLIVVWCRPEQQRERLLARGLNAEQISLRMAAQMSVEAKRRCATDEIDNSGAFEQTRQQVQRLSESLRRQAGVPDGEQL